MLHFNEDLHQYSVDGKNLISVTQLLSKHGLTPDYSFIDADVLQKAAAYGTMVHKEIEDYINTGSVGMSWECEAFKNNIESKNIKPVVAECKVYNDLVAGTIDLIALKDDGFYFIDHKTTSELHKDALSWQLSVYIYLACYGNSDDLNIKLEYEQIKGGLGYWYDKKTETLKPTYIMLKPIEEIEKLMEAERTGTLYEAPKTIIDLVSEELRKLDKEIEEKTQRRDELKAELQNQMETYGFYKVVANDGFSATYIAPTESVGFDSTRFKKDNPELFKKYNTKVTHRSSQLRIDYDKESNNE